MTRRMLHMPKCLFPTGRRAILAPDDDTPQRWSAEGHLSTALRLQRRAYGQFSRCATPPLVLLFPNAYPMKGGRPPCE